MRGTKTITIQTITCDRCSADLTLKPAYVIGTTDLCPPCFDRITEPREKPAPKRRRRSQSTRVPARVVT